MANSETCRSNCANSEIYARIYDAYEHGIENTKTTDKGHHPRPGGRIKMRTQN